MIASVLVLLLLQATPAGWPPVTEADFVAKNFRFTSGETLPELNTAGHGTHTLAAVWKPHLAELLGAGGRRRF